MNVIWGWPLALAGLAALAVPVLLHLDRRRSVQVLRFAALRWVLAQARPRRTWRLVEWALLALRLLLVALLVAWLAQPSLRGWPHRTRQWVAVVPGATLPATGESTVWLADGFPATSEAMPVAGAPIASLLREFDARLPAGDTLEVRVPRVIGGLDAAPIALTRAVAWTIDGESDVPTPPAPRKRVLALRYADESLPALRYVRAAIAAWQASPETAVTLEEAPLDAAVPANADAVLRLEATPTGGVDAAGAERYLAAQLLDGSIAAPLRTSATDASRSARVVALPSLDASLTHSADFPRWLHRATFGDPPPPDRAPAAAVAPVVGAAPFEPPAQPLQRWLAWIAAAAFLLERVIANGRRLRGTP